MSKIAVIGIAGESVFLTVDTFGKEGETTVAKEIQADLRWEAWVMKTKA